MPLVIKIPEREFYDNVKEEFVYSKGATLILEHSLLSISKWESKWHKPYLTKETKTEEEQTDYIKCMSLSGNIDDSVLSALGRKEKSQIMAYLEDPMTATTITDHNKKPSREIITSELIYYWMTALNIPFDPCQKWHINRLIMLIKICNAKNNPKKMNKREVMMQNHALNKARRKALHTKG